MQRQENILIFPVAKQYARDRRILFNECQFGENSDFQRLDNLISINMDTLGDEMF